MSVMSGVMRASSVIPQLEVTMGARDHHSRTVERSLARRAPGADGHDVNGLAPDTIKGYWRRIHHMQAWARGRETTIRGRVVRPSIMPASSETVTDYLGDLARQGASFSLMRATRTAIIWWHRSEGQPVPDGLASLGVLRDRHHTLTAAGQGPRDTKPIPLEHVVQLARACDPGTRRGVRDRALVMLAYVGKLGATVLARLNVGDVRPAGGSAGELDVHTPGRVVRIPHWADVDGRHADVCPVESIWALRTVLADGGAPGGSALLRPVDSNDRMCGLDPRWHGTMPADLRLKPNGGLQYALLLALRRARLDGAGYTLLSFKIGGVVADRAAGALTAQIAAAAGYVPDSPALAAHMAKGEARRRGARPGVHQIPPRPMSVEQNTLPGLEPSVPQGHAQPAAAPVPPDGQGVLL